MWNGIIEPSVSPWANPVVLVKKTDDTLRLRIDYRNLNKATIKDSYPLSHIQDTLDTLYGNNLFTTLDLLKGYHQTEVEESSRKKTDFATHIGHQCPCFFSRSLGTRPPRLHWQSCHPILWLKSHFARNSVEFCGHLSTLEGIGPNKKNIKTVTSFPTPAKANGASSFLGLCNYYRRFIKNYLVLDGLLLQLLKKNAVFHWQTPQHESFIALKERLTTAHILAYPDFSIPFPLYWI